MCLGQKTEKNRIFRVLRWRHNVHPCGNWLSNALFPGHDRVLSSTSRSTGSPPNNSWVFLDLSGPVPPWFLKTQRFTIYIHFIYFYLIFSYTCLNLASWVQASTLTSWLPDPVELLALRRPCTESGRSADLQLLYPSNCQS